MAKILIIEDNSHNIEITRRYLEKAGYEVFALQDGNKAMATIEKTGCDLVILDIMMPARNGYEVLEEIRATYSQKELPVIMLSALDTPFDPVASKRLGATDFIEKPVDSTKLVYKVQIALVK